MKHTLVVADESTDDLDIWHARCCCGWESDYDVDTEVTETEACLRADLHVARMALESVPVEVCRLFGWESDSRERRDLIAEAKRRAGVE